MSKSSKAQILTHTFRTHAPGAKTVFLAGSFNSWEPSALPMKNTKGGDWVVTIDLSPGRHEYKFVVDGQWCCEPGHDDLDESCPGRVPNELGTMNCILELSATEIS